MASRQYKPQQPRQANYVPPRKIRRFRWWLLWGPAAVVMAVWVSKSIKIDFTWESAMRAMNIHDKNSFSKLALLGTLCVAGAAMARILRGNQDKED